MLHKLKHALLPATFFSMAIASVAAADNISVGRFSIGSLAAWEAESFSSKTRYSLVDLDGNTVLRAVSDKSASGLVREISINLIRTPYLNWSWRVENVLDSINEQEKNGDDYPARIYIVISGGLAFWRTRALNYVWASHTPQYQSWPNAFAEENVIMLAIRSGSEAIGKWQHEKRNLLIDLEQAFGEAITKIDAVALMTDTDNTQGKAIAYYGDIYFSAQ